MLFDTLESLIKWGVESIEAIVESRRRTTRSENPLTRNLPYGWGEIATRHAGLTEQIPADDGPCRL